jgi:hypothetical protein
MSSRDLNDPCIFSFFATNGRIKKFLLCWGYLSFPAGVILLLPGQYRMP